MSSECVQLSHYFPAEVLTVLQKKPTAYIKPCRQCQTRTVFGIGPQRQRQIRDSQIDEGEDGKEGSQLDRKKNKES